MNPSKDTPMTTKESEVDVLAVMEDAARRTYVNAETQEDNDASDALLKARAAVAEVFERAEYLCRTGEGMIAFRTALRNAGVKV